MASVLPSLTPSPATSERSTFVTVLAWIFIALSGLWTLIALLQNIAPFCSFSSFQR
jgi:hypothetical protein